MSILQIFGLIVFNSTHTAIKTEDVLKTLNFAGRLIPAPEKIVAGCGFAWKFELEDHQQIVEILKQQNIEYANMYRVEKIGIKSEYFLLE